MASVALPKEFVPLTTVANHRISTFSVIGVVMSMLDPVQSTKGDWFITVGLQSPEGHIRGLQPVKVRFFRESQDRLPKIHRLGDVVYAFVHKDTRNQPDLPLISQKRAIACVFPEDKIPHQELQDALALLTGNNLVYSATPFNNEVVSQETQNYVMYLANWYRSTFATKTPTAKQPAKPNNMHTSNKYSSLKNIKSGNYYDIVVEVIKKWDDNARMTLHVTDYTENPNFFDHSDAPVDTYIGKSPWPGPRGRRSLEVTLFSPHSHWAKDNVNVGSMVIISNLRTVQNSMTGLIEGKLHTDQRFPDKICVSMLNQRDERFVALRNAQASYNKQFPTTDICDADQIIGLRQEEQPKQPGKKERKKLKKQQQRLEAQKKLSEDRANAPKTNPFTSAQGPNETIVDTHADKAPQLIRTILQSEHLHDTTEHGHHITYPFINICFRIQARVVDFFPKYLEDFSKSLDDNEYNTNSDDLVESTMDLDLTPDKRWEWAFWLLVEDHKQVSSQTPDQMKILVAGQDAEYLLNMDACDLRANHEELNKLRSKLFHLWGELEEYKRNGSPQGKQPSSRPFQCCVQEYGVQDSEGAWIRMHRIWETTIKA